MAGYMLPFSANNLYFREWEDSDLGDMVRLFDTEEMNRWTPLPSPFTAEVASEYVARAKDAKLRNGTLHLAVCAAAGGPPLGEVILFPSEHPDTVEVAYAVGVAHRGEHIGARAVAAVLDLARMVGARRAILTIASDNAASQGTASAARFARTDTPLRRRERKGFVLQMETWERRL